MCLITQFTADTLNELDTNIFMYDIANCITTFRENLIHIVSMPNKIECVSRCLGISMSDLIFVTEIKYDGTQRNYQIGIFNFNPQESCGCKTVYKMMIPMLIAFGTAKLVLLRNLRTARPKQNKNFI